MSLKSIEGYATDKTAQWPTFSGRSMCRVAADLHLMVHCHKSDSWADGEKSQLAQLLHRGLLVRRVSDPPGRWWFVIGHMYSVSIVLKAVEHAAGPGDVVYTLAPITKQNLRMWSVLDPDEYESLPFEWHTPFSFAASFSSKPPLYGIFAAPTGLKEGFPA